RAELELHRQRRLQLDLDERRVLGRVRDGARGRDGAVSQRGETARSVRGPLMETAATRIALRLWALLVVCFLWIPLVVIGVYAFNESNIQSWPISGWSTHWFSVAWHDEDVRNALWPPLRT